MSKYPNPCDSCHRCDTCRDFRGCTDYLKRFYTIWKQFNSYPARIYKKVKNMKREKFVYEHPDIIRQYLQKGPCEECHRAETCENPCVEYLLWWDARMELLKRRWGHAERR